jgi:subtilisin family serine protease
MMRSIVTEPLLGRVEGAPLTARFDVIVVLNELFEGGIEAARRQVEQRAAEWQVGPVTYTSHYVFATLTGAQVRALADEARQLQQQGAAASVVFRIWEDADVEVQLVRSRVTVKADAAHRAFRAAGRDIVWAVLDSGIDGTHPHFAPRTWEGEPVRPLDRAPPIEHLDFTPAAADPHDPADGIARPSALVDRLGHGTHVAGIIAGAWRSDDGTPAPVVGTETRLEADPFAPGATDLSGGRIASQKERRALVEIAGIAPCTTLVSLKVIADRTLEGRQQAGQGKVSWLLRAIERIQAWNQHGKRLLVHGVNISLGYPFDARWFGCGQSPLCLEVDRLVRSGVVVVVSAGNDGYPRPVSGPSAYAMASITDPGNAALAITVGSTHRDMPHTYGVSYFSSRGPTGDGRQKPDLLAPGERIWSCAAGALAAEFGAGAGGAATPPVLYCEQTGTSMAAPHVSGAVAAFLSVRREFIGQPERIKALLLASAIDLQRERWFQGAGLLDLVKLLHLV